MHLNVKLIIGIFLAFISSASFAELPPQSFKGFYLGGNVSKHQFNESFTNGSIVGAMLRVGYDFNSIFALEGHIGGTTAKSYILVDDQGQEIGDYNLRAAHAGVYGRANWRLLNVTLYGLLGIGYYSAIETISNNGPMDGTYKNEATGLSFGAGVDLFGGQQTALSLNWIQLINKDTDDGQKLHVNALYLGITYYFKPQKTNHPLEPRDRLNY